MIFFHILFILFMFLSDDSFYQVVDVSDGQELTGQMFSISEIGNYNSTCYY